MIQKLEQKSCEECKCFDVDEWQNGTIHPCLETLLEWMIIMMMAMAHILITLALTFWLFVTPFIRRVQAISKCHLKGLKQDKVLLLAHYLDNQLFKSAANMQSYSNVYTIDERVKKACTALAYRKLARKRKQSGTSWKKSVHVKHYNEAYAMFACGRYRCGGMFWRDVLMEGCI